MIDILTLTEREELLEQLRAAEEKAENCLVTAALYHRLLSECKDLAQENLNSGNPNLAHAVLAHANLAVQKSSSDGLVEDWRRSWAMDIEWLKMSLKALKEIQAIAEAEVAPECENLRARIVTATKKVLDRGQAIPSNVSLHSL